MAPKRLWVAATYQKLWKTVRSQIIAFVLSEKAPSDCVNENAT